MNFPANAYQSFTDKEVVDGVINTKKIYDDLASVNTNSSAQTKSKFKLCISLSETLDGILQGKVFGVSCTYRDWHRKVKHIKVDRSHYVTCISKVLSSGVSAYLPNNMEVLSYSAIRAKIEDPSNGFKEKAEIKEGRYKEIRNLFKAHLRYSDSSSKSVEAIKALINEVADISVLKSYGVNIKR